MKCSFSLLLLIISLLTAIGQSSVLGTPKIIKQEQLDYFFNFEDESAGIDQSQGPVKWKIEDIDSPWEPDYPAPEPQSGKKYIRVDRGSTKTFGVAVLSFQDIFVYDSEFLNVTFSMWIHSKWPKFNDLQLYVVEKGKETLLIDLSQFYVNENQWYKALTPEYKLSQTSTNISLVFYAFCGTNVEDVIAIDNIDVILSSNGITSTETTTKESDTQKNLTTTVDTTLTITPTSVFTTIIDTTTSTKMTTSIQRSTMPTSPCIPTPNNMCQTKNPKARKKIL